MLDYALRLLHPFMPFLTEELWQNLPGHGPSIMISEFPEPDPALVKPELEERIKDLQDAVTVIRKLRAENLVPLSGRVKVLIIISDDQTREFFERNRHYLECPPQVNSQELLISKTGQKSSTCVSSPTGKGEVCVDLAGLVDFDKELARMRKEREKLEQGLERVEQSLSQPGFAERAPREVIEKQMAIKDELREKLATVKENLERMGKLKSQGK